MKVKYSGETFKQFLSKTEEQSQRECIVYTLQSMNFVKLFAYSFKCSVRLQ